MSEPGSRRRLGLLAALLAAGAYGFNAPFAAVAAKVGVSGPDLVLWRVFAMLAVVAALAVALRRRLSLPRPVRPGVLLVSLATATLTLAYISAVAFVPVGVAVIVFYTFPLMILIASPFLDGERPDAARLAVFALAFAGLLVAIGPGFGGLDPRGLGLAVLAAIATAVQIFAASRVAPRTDPIALVWWVHVGVLPVALAVAILIGGPVSPSLMALAPVAVFANVVGYIVGFLLQMRAVSLGKPAAIGLAFTLEPVVAVATAAVVLGETLVVTQYAGGALVLAALVASVLVEDRRAKGA